MSRESRPEILQPFVEADNFIRNLFILWQASVPLKRDDDFWHQVDNLDQVITQTEQAQAEFHGSLRASELTPAEARDFLQRGLVDNSDRDTSDHPTFINFLIYQVAFNKLLQMSWATYDELHSADQIVVWPPVSQETSDWFKNRTPEHTYRELEFTARILKRLANNPPKAVNRDFYNVLRVGHTMAAITQVASQ